MANLRVKNGAGADVYLSASGAGTDADPLVPVHGVNVLDTELAVTGPLTDTELRATAVAVSGPLTRTQLDEDPVQILGTVTVNSVASGLLTDAELRASAIAVSGPLTDTELRASAVPVSGVLTDTELRASAVPVAMATRTITTVTGTVATSGDTTLVAAPGAGNRLVVDDVFVQLEAATATVVLLKNSATTIWRFRMVADGDYARLDFPEGKEIRLMENGALVLNLSGANQVGYTVRYRTEAV